MLGTSQKRVLKQHSHTVAFHYANIKHKLFRLGINFICSHVMVVCCFQVCCFCFTVRGQFTILHDWLHLGKKKCITDVLSNHPGTAFPLHFVSDLPHQGYYRPEPLQSEACQTCWALSNLCGESLKYSSDVREGSSIGRLSPKQNGSNWKRL